MILFGSGSIIKKDLLWTSKRQLIHPSFYLISIYTTSEMPCGVSSLLWISFIVTVALSINQLYCQSEHSFCLYTSFLSLDFSCSSNCFLITLKWYPNTANNGSPDSQRRLILKIKKDWNAFHRNPLQQIPRTPRALRAHPLIRPLCRLCVLKADYWILICTGRSSPWIQNSRLCLHIDIRLTRFNQEGKQWIEKR